MPDLSGSEGVYISINTFKDVRPGDKTQTIYTEVSDHYVMRMPPPESYAVAFTKAGYFRATLPDGGDFADITQTRLVMTSRVGETRLRENSTPGTNALSRETGAGKSYVIPALEIPAFLFLLNMYDRVAYADEKVEGKKIYETNLSTFWKHLTQDNWVVDRDSFSINQFAHPYQGTMHHGFARSAGLNFWESLLYANAGSFLWELGGETTRPSINDQIATGTGGSFFGEALFRMADLMLENNGGKPGLWREIGAAVISPATGFNRLAFGNRFKTIFSSHQPATFWSARLGANLNSDLNDENGQSSINRIEPAADFSLAYGLPGQPGYSYSRPFDYFHFEISGRGSSKNALENVMIRGLLLGRRYAAGNTYRGIWGLYGGYDYISPYMIPVSSTSASLGTTFQWWLSQTSALQGSVLGGIGYAGAGYLIKESHRDYHYGIAPQGLLALRLILADRAMLDFTGRSYYVSDRGGNEKERTEFINRLTMGATVRVHGHHALGLQYIATLRDARHPDPADAHQTAGTVSLFYTWLVDTRFGAVDWRGN